MKERPVATAKAKETREKIYEAALRLFGERGFDETTMRDVSAAAGVATGAAYYYFRSKNDIVMEFYVRSAQEMEPVAAELFASTKDVKKRVSGLTAAKLEQFAPHRKLLSALFRTAVDPADPLSPFGDETTGLREQAIALFAEAIAGSSTKIPKDLAPHLPRLLWLHQMGMILFWIFDRSPKQVKTFRLMEGTIDLVIKLLSLATLPLIGGLRKSTVKLLEAVLD